jgi:dCMP deaminase
MTAMSSDTPTTPSTPASGAVTPARPDWDTYFLEIAKAVALRADCTRSKVGAVVVREHRIMATGYNGYPAGSPGCLSDGICPRGQLSREELLPGSSYDSGPGVCGALHAEQNALLYCSYDQRQGATLYITRDPCEGCTKMLSGAGLSRVVTPTRKITYGLR